MIEFYFDTNATTPVSAEVFDAMKPFFREHYGNPSSSHHFANTPAQAIRTARRQLVVLLGAEQESEIIFTGGGTEANNAAIRAALKAHPQKKHIITSAVEHSSVLRLCRELQKEGYRLTELQVDAQGCLDLEELRSALSEDTALVSLMLANNETGVLFPVFEIGKELKERDVLFHVDAIQAVGKLPLDLKSRAVDFFSVSAHKLYGPKGVGALYVRNSVAFTPLLIGGSHERGRRAGTENVPGIVGFGKACESIKENLEKDSERLVQLRDYFEGQIMTQFPTAVIQGKSAPRLPNTSNICFRGFDSETLIALLDQKGICVSSGSACMSGAAEPSHVLKAMGLSDEEASSALRFSFGRHTDQKQIEFLVESLQECFSQLSSKQQKKESSVSVA